MDTKRHESKYITFVTIFCESANVNLVKRKKISILPARTSWCVSYILYIYLLSEEFTKPHEIYKRKWSFWFSFIRFFFFNPSLAKEMRFKKKKRKRRKSSCRLVVISSTTNEKSIAIGIETNFATEGEMDLYRYAMRNSTKT
jgi:hypothetical protein